MSPFWLMLSVILSIFPETAFGMGLGLAVYTDRATQSRPGSLGELKWAAPAAAIW
jgi:hypothetical protein